jgi:hypothetical protein
VPNELTDLHDWLTDTWRDAGPPVVVVEGFSGVGKTALARTVVAGWPHSAALVTATNTQLGLDDLLLDVAAQLEAAGDGTMADQPDFDLMAGMFDAISGGSLIVIDSLDEIVDIDARTPPPDLVRMVQKATRTNLAGRILLLTNQSLADGPWLEGVDIHKLTGPKLEDAVEILNSLLSARGLEDEIPPNKRQDVVMWLGRNPQAMRSLVSCLQGDTLEELIRLDPDAWELRQDVVSPKLVAKLEGYFLDRTIHRLDAEALLLTELLSVYRKPFQKEAITRLSHLVTDINAAMDALQSRFLLGMTRGWWALHPVVRQLAIARLAEKPDREISAHRAASDHFMRRIEMSPGRTNLRSVGDNFVEARYHLLNADREVEFEGIASTYRGQLLRTYKNITVVPNNEDLRKHLLAVLSSSLTYEDAGFAQLRVILARLLIARGRHDDGRIALRQLSIASRESDDIYCWTRRLDLIIQYDGLRAGRTIVEQGIKKLHPSFFWLMYRRYADALIAAGRDADALKWLDDALEVVPPETRSSLYTISAFVLARNRRAAEAIDLLVSGFRDVSISDPRAWRLIEEALFIAYANGSRQHITGIKSIAREHGLHPTVLTLSDTLSLELDEKFEEAAKLSQNELMSGLAYRSAFSHLCSGNIQAASAALSQMASSRTQVANWLGALIALCSGQRDLYETEMESYLGRPLSPDEAADPLLWLREWDKIPSALSSFPAFYFPYLPRSLTQLEVQIRRLHGHPSMLDSIDLEGIRLPTSTILASDGTIDTDRQNYSSAPNLITESGALVSEIRILFLSSNPEATSRLSLDEEMREIELKIKLSESRDRLKVVSKWAVRPDDLLQYLNEEKPHIVHFSGHGSARSEIILTGNNGEPRPVGTEALTALFRTLKDNLRVVVLNSCYSYAQATAIQEVIECVVGMNDSVDDTAARIFASAFYRGLGFNRTIGESFDQAKTALLLEGFDQDAEIPELLASDAAKAQRLIR